MIVLLLLLAFTVGFSTEKHTLNEVSSFLSLPSWPSFARTDPTGPSPTTIARNTANMALQSLYSPLSDTPNDNKLIFQSFLGISEDHAIESMTDGTGIDFHPDPRAHPPPPPFPILPSPPVLPSLSDFPFLFNKPNLEPADSQTLSKSLLELNTRSRKVRKVLK